MVINPYIYSSKANIGSVVDWDPSYVEEEYEMLDLSEYTSGRLEEKTLSDNLTHISILKTSSNSMLIGRTNMSIIFSFASLTQYQGNYHDRLNVNIYAANPNNFDKISNSSIYFSPTTTTIYSNSNNIVLCSGTFKVKLPPIYNNNAIVFLDSVGGTNNHFVPDVVYYKF